MKKSKCSFWIKQLRRPICALVALCIVVFYCMVSYAAESGVTFADRYNLEEITIQDGLFAKSMYDRYSAEHDGSVLSLYSNGQSFFGFNDIYRFMSSSLSNWNLNGGYYSNFVSQASNHVIPDSIVDQSVTYNLSGCYIIMSSGDDHWTYIVSEGYCCIVDGYIVSASPFHVFTNWRGNYHVTTASQNGLYVYSMDDGVNWEYIQFTDLDVFFRSSDGDTGYTTFSISSVGDFDIESARNDYYNFNYLKTGGIIVAPGDPAENPYNADGEHYNYGSISHKVFGHPFDYLYYGTTIGINSYMRDNSNRYWLYTDAKIGVKFAGDNDISEFEQNDSVSLSSFIRNGSYNYSQRLDPGLMLNGGQSLSAKLHTKFQTITGSDYNYSDGSWGLGSFEDEIINGPYIDYRTYTYKGLNNSLVGSSDSKLEVAYLDLTTWFSYDGTEDDILNVDYTSGMYHIRFNLLDGTYNVLQNDVVQNLNPIEGESNLPITGGDSSSNITNNYPINVTQGSISNNLNAIIEYLFQLDASGMQNVSQNVGSTIQYVISNIGNTNNVENGFWDVLKKGYSVIPDDIWNWVKISVATLLSGAVITWVYNGVRVKRG